MVAALWRIDTGNKQQIIRNDPKWRIKWLGNYFREYDLSSEILTKKLDFEGATNGSNPRGALLQASDGNYME
jgi:hypothetical protein